MKALVAAKRAAGIAAPQIGVSKRFFVMRPGVLWWVCINPEIVKVSEEWSNSDEGCLSLPGLRRKVHRPTSISVEFFNVDWQKESWNLHGINARVFQHELDHLNGILIA